MPLYLVMRVEEVLYDAAVCVDANEKTVSLHRCTAQALKCDTPPPDVYPPQSHYHQPKKSDTLKYTRQ